MGKRWFFREREMNFEFSGDSGKFHLCLGAVDPSAVRQDGYAVVVKLYNDLGLMFSAHSTQPFRMIVGGVESSPLTEAKWTARPRLEMNKEIVDIVFSSAAVGKITLRVERLLKKEPGVRH